MKGYTRTTITSQNLEIDDHVKVAGVLYRITKIESIGSAYAIQLQNARRPKLQGLLTLDSNTLMNIWNQK